MRQNLVPTYRLFPGLGVARRLGRFARAFRRAAHRLASRVQELGTAADRALLASLKWLSKQAVGRELDVVEAGKLLLFLHKVIIAAFIAGYVVGYLVR